MTTVKEGHKKFVTQATGRGGKPSGQAGSWWWRGRIMYYNETASWRVIPGAGGKHGPKWVLLYRYYQTPDKKVLDAHKMVAIKVPDIAVFSVYADDMLADERVHERVRYIMIIRIKHLLEETLPPIGGDTLQGKKGDDLKKEMARFKKEYEAYAEATGCGWPAFPEFYVNQLNNEIKRKVDAYMQPAAVIRRDRAHARRVALKALNVDTSAEGSA